MAKSVEVELESAGFLDSEDPRPEIENSVLFFRFDFKRGKTERFVLARRWIRTFPNGENRNGNRTIPIGQYLNLSV